MLQRVLGENIQISLTLATHPLAINADSGMTGKELAQRLLSVASDLKIIYISGYSVELTGTDFTLEEGVNFLAKPFEIQRLAKVVWERLDAN
jgi:FixJ family two-component response regulator